MCLDVDDKDVSVSNSGEFSPRRLRVAVAGLGVIGEGAALELAKQTKPYGLCAALVRDPGKARAQELENLRTYSDPAVMLVEHPDVIVDALPSGEVGRWLIEAALSKGVSIVTANKQAIAGSLALLHKYAHDHGAVLSYSPSVGGGAPMVETVRKAREEGSPREIRAILNGTVNYILSAMKNGASFTNAVISAQEAGFAEPDPTADLSGEDARAKISILTYEAFGHEIDLDAIEVEPLSAEKAGQFVKSGGVWKQIAHVVKSQDGQTKAKVSFERVDEDPLFSKTEKEGNALRVTCTDGRALTCSGKGAGRAPTVSSIFADLERVAVKLTALEAEHAKNALRRGRTFS
ncbi:hypothetical protein PUV54_12885 [Hyphococcus flavus]|uniref:Homoserine dehydrogenase n=1 Tax=Hyphococcus flavus TaxID=1866326 RepID=A0AAF0CBF7_9PROT|nr:hypothetical protein [Hyphococcus flavus]WDI30850.1 hypothetical protein PUV54_12885 [Hyphococcus flavus]